MSDNKYDRLPREELLRILKARMSEVLEIGFSQFVTAVGLGHSELSRFAEPHRAIECIARLLGDEVVAVSWKEAEEEFRKGWDPQDWDIYTRGSTEERDALRDRLWKS